jgi:hypothetical protein
MWRLLDNTVLSNFAAVKRPEIVVHLWPGEVCATPVMIFTRAVARSRGIALSGTLGILAACPDFGILTIAQANALLKKMIAAGYRSPVDHLGQI